MHYWQTILEEVEKYTIPGYTCHYSNLQENDIYREHATDHPSNTPTTAPRSKQVYPLPPPLQHLYLTEREAECI